MSSWKYSLLLSNKTTDPDAKAAPQLLIPVRVLRFLSAILVLILVVGGSFIAGRSSTSNSGGYAFIDVDRTFVYDRKFAGASSNHSNQAWVEIFPEHGTFFLHPTLRPPQRSTLSTYHQLHCLNGIRVGFWQAYEAALDGRKLEEKDMGPMSSPAHIRHCIDLLRQSLMCDADTTFEVKDEDAGGVHGFGVQHRCKDWDHLNSLVTGWQTNHL